MTAQPEYFINAPFNRSISSVVPLSIDSSGNAQVPSATTPLVVGTPCPAALYTGQAVIAVTGTAVQLPSHALVNGLCVKSKLSNVGDVMVGPSGVTNTEDGTGNGFILAPGDSITLSVSNSNLVYVNGTAGAVVSFLEN